MTQFETINRKLNTPLPTGRQVGKGQTQNRKLKTQNIL
jgi:hypothetical protein